MEQKETNDESEMESAREKCDEIEELNVWQERLCHWCDICSHDFNIKRIHDARTYAVSQTLRENKTC